MPRMTPELLLSNNSYLNPLKDRELNLRGYQIPAIENLGVTKDSLDAIDLTDNSIRSLINLPKLNRLKHLYLSNNPISFISPNLSQSIPNLNSLVLTNCNLSNLNQVFSVLKNFRRLEILVLTGNPICKVKLYRDWCIFTCPKVRILDYIRVKDKERRTAKELFYDATSKSLTPLAQSLSIVDPTGPVDPDHQLSLNNQQSQNVEPGQLGQKLTAEERERIKDSIEKASSVEEVRRLKRMLDQGFIPKEPRKPEVQKDASKEEEQPKETPSKEPKKSIKKRSPSKRQKK
ncbi:leucine-rich repeat-domain-containing protein [Phakopsora pachyrhizi]|nr:leucine-rich repeat-domain-containing protein [Phakopsora pachyrhizi]